MIKTQYPFYKGTALGNDYIVIDPNRFTEPLSHELVVKMCDPHYGIGSDGILYGPSLVGEKFGLTIFNPDGSEAEKSGNGLRIFAQYLCREGYVNIDSFEIMTKGGAVFVKRLDPSATMFSISMGQLTFRDRKLNDGIIAAGDIGDSIELDGNAFQVYAVSIGNPHCVLIMPDISKELALILGPRIEVHQMFPERTNVQFVKVIDRNNIRMEIWERGAGYTLASGSSACAAAGVCRKLDLCDNMVDVHMVGGVLAVEIGANFNIMLTGPASSIATGFFTGGFMGI